MSQDGEKKDEAQKAAEAQAEAEVAAADAAVAAAEAAAAQAAAAAAAAKAKAEALAAKAAAATGALGGGLFGKAKGALGAVADAGKGAAAAVGDAASGAVDGAKDLASGAVDGAKDLASGAVDGAKDLASGAVDGAKDLASGAADAVGDAASATGKAAKGVATGAAGAVATAAGAVKDAATGAASKVAGAVTGGDASVSTTTAGGSSATYTSSNNTRLKIEPTSAGLFDTKAIDEKAGERYVPEKAYLKGAKRSKLAMAVLALVTAGIVGGVAYIMSDSEARADMEAFLRGSDCGPSANESCIRVRKFAKVRAQERLWQEEDFRSRHIYGDVTLNYFPQDAKVEIFQKRSRQDGDAFKRREAGAGEPVCGKEKMNAKCEISLENETHNLKERQRVEQLPLKNLPIYITTKDDTTGEVTEVHTYSYRIVFSREGYEPREFVWDKKDWTRMNPNYQMQWNGLDLVPKPETYKENFGKAMADIFCYQKLKNLGSIAQIKPADLDMILKRNGFKTKELFATAEKQLTSGQFAGWWSQEQSKISMQTCITPPPQ